MANPDQVLYQLIDSADLKVLLDAAHLILSGQKQPAVDQTAPQLLTSKQFMEAVGIKRTYFYQLVATGRLKSIKKGRKIRVPVSELDRYWNDKSFK